MRLMVLLLAGGIAMAAVEMTLDPRAVNDAIAIGQSRIERNRTRFHQPYRLSVNKPPVDYIEVITPFRRVVVAAESRAQIGDRSFGQRMALELLDAAPAQIEFVAEFTFHPLNTYVGVPNYRLTLVDGRGAPVEPRTFERRPRHGPRVEGMPIQLPIPGGLLRSDGTEPLLGGTLIATFDGRLLNPSGVYQVVIDEEGKELARVAVELGKLR